MRHFKLMLLESYLHLIIDSIDVFQKVAVYLLINAVQYAIGIDCQRKAFRFLRPQRDLLLYAESI